MTVPCARTLDPVDVDLDSEIFLLLAPAGPRPEGTARRPRKQRQPAPKQGEQKGKTSKKSAEAAEALEEADAARDTYGSEEVVLDDFVREFLLLELPMFPLRADLRSDGAPAISTPLETQNPEPVTRDIDPRLAPLAAIASRLSEKKR